MTSPAQNVSARSLRVLIVEDEPMIAELYAEVLSALGHEACLIVHSEQEAVDAALYGKPDLMIVDEHLQDGCGRKAMSRILAQMPIPHLFVSGRAIHPEAGRRPVFLQKPFNEAQLVRAIDEAIRLCAPSSSDRTSQE